MSTELFPSFASVMVFGPSIVSLRWVAVVGTLLRNWLIVRLVGCG